MRFTFAALTPGVLSSACCTRLLQPAQCMPDTGIVQVVGVAVVMVSAGGRAGKNPRGKYVGGRGMSSLLGTCEYGAATCKRVGRTPSNCRARGAMLLSSEAKSAT